MRILLVSAEPGVWAWLHRALLESGHSLREARQWRDGIHLAGEEAFDAIVLIGAQTDRLSGLREALPRFAGLIGRGMVVVVVPPDTGAPERSALLRGGADMCLRMPVSVLELQARLTAFARANCDMHVGTAVVQREARGTTTPPDLAKGPHARLTRREALLLDCLRRHVNLPVPRDEIIRYAWPDAEDVYPATINLAVSRLRRKLSRQAGLAHARIETVSRYGYQLSVPGAESRAPRQRSM